MAINLKNAKKIAAIKAVFSLSFCVLVSGLARAEAPVSDALSPGESSSRWVLGGTFLAGDNPYVNDGDSDDKNFIGLTPRLEYRGERIFLDAEGLGLTLFRKANFSVGGIITGDSSYLSYEENYEDNKALVGIRERDTTWNAGLYLIGNLGAGQIRLKAVQEVSSEHDGQVVDLSYSHNFSVGDRLNITPRIGVEWASSEWVNYFFGVSAEEAEVAPYISAYNTGSAYSTFAEIDTRYEFSKHWDAELGVSVFAYGKNIKYSPLIQDATTVYLRAGVNYNF